MKKLTAFILSFIMLISMTACSGEKQQEQTSQADSQITVTENETPADEADGVRPEFKKAMDEYEAFFDRYIEFIKKYETANSAEAISLMADYMQYMADFAEAMEAMEEMGEREMSTAEALYYAQVTSRISRKLMAVA